MGYRPSGKKPKLPPFVALTWDLLNSKAYRDLPFAAAKALPFFIGKPKIHFGNALLYHTDFQLSYGEGERLGFAPATFSKVLKALIANGFLDPIDKGGLRGNGKSCSKFRISRRWEKYGTSEFQKIDWEQFQPRA